MRTNRLSKLLRASATLTLLALASFHSLLSARAQGTAFTYQGRLNDGGNPANGSYSLRFTLYDASTGGNMVGSPQVIGPVAVNNGLFTVPLLNFGDGVFTGTTYWLQIEADIYSASPSYTPLTPRQQLTPAPYAIYAESAGAANIAYSVANNAVTTASFSTAGGTPVPGSVLGLNSGGALQWLAPSAGGASGGWGLTGNSGTTPGTDFLGTTDSQPLELWAGNARALRLEPGAGAPNVIGGFLGNTVGANNEGATVAGGGMSGLPNSELAPFGTIGGGDQNSIQSWASQATISGGSGNTIQSYAADSFIGGGVGNTVRSDQVSWLNLDGVFGAIAGGQGNTIPTSSPYAFIGGGTGNTAGGTAAAVAGGIGNTTYYYASAVGGGQSNMASGYFATVSGGYGNSALQGSAWVGGGAANTASGYASMVPGGLGNTASGAYSFAAGDSAKAVNNGTFVWADASSGAPFSSTLDNTFNVRATGGVNFLTGGHGITIDGQQVATGAGSGTGSGSGNAWLTTGNANADPAAGYFLGTTDANGFELHVNNSRAVRLDFADNTVGSATLHNLRQVSGINVNCGYWNNTIGDGAVGATIAGGGDAYIFSQGAGVFSALYPNAVTANFGTVGGGHGNTAGSQATVPGGFNNSATGDGSFAAGRSAQTTYDGNFVWGDGTAVFSGSGANSFDVLASGGVGFYGAPGASTLRVLANGFVGINENTPKEQLEVNGEYMLVDGWGNEQAYLGGDGVGNDVQIGSLNPLVSAVSCYNPANKSYMHLYCSSITIQGGADLAEPFQISSAEREVPQGAVVVIDDENPGHLKLSESPYDAHVAGVVSGANGINPGIQMQQQGLLEGGKNVALTGRVYVQADASNGAIHPGDLLTTSSNPGRAMKVSDHSKAQGAILGKAMTGLKEGQGMVLVLVTLQ